MVRSRSAWFMTATAAVALGMLILTTTAPAVVSAQGADSSICETVKCIANGDAECNRATATCPACMYTISGGYSCYDKIDGACPYPDLLMTCPPKAAPTLAPTPAPTPKPTLAPVTESPATVVPPEIDTPPATTVVSSATSPPATTTPSPASTDAGSATAGTHPNSVQNNPTSSSTVTSSGSSSSLRNGSEAGGPSTSAARGTTSESTSTLTPSPDAHVMDSSSGIANTDDKVSSLYVNIGVVVAGVGGVAIVAIFIVRRMKKQRQEGFLKTPEDSNKQFNLQVDGRSTPSNGGRGAGLNGGSAVVGAGAGAGAVGFAASSHSDAPSLLSMGSLDSSTAEFANHHYPYGLPSQFGLPSEASSYARSSNNSHAGSTISSATFGGYNQSSARGGARPQAIQEGDELTHQSKRKQSVGATAVAVGGGARTPGKSSSRKQSVGATAAAIDGARTPGRNSSRKQSVGGSAAAAAAAATVAGAQTLGRNSSRKQSVGGSAAAAAAAAVAGAQTPGKNGSRKQSVGGSAAAAAAGGARTPGKNGSRPVHQPIYHETVRRKSSAISLSSGNTYEDEYDIVRPGALKDADRRNTETLVKDGRFQSNFSEQDVRSIQQDRFFASKEHEI